MWITVDDGPDKGKTVELSTGAFTIGRHPESNLVLADDEASSHHAVIETDAEGKATLRDLNSTNGTFLNGSKIEGGIPLEGSEHLRIGQSSLTVSERPPNATVISARPTVERPADAAPPSPPPSTSPVPSAPASPAPVLQGSVEDKPPGSGVTTAPPPPFAPGGGYGSGSTGSGRTKWIVAAAIAALVVVGVVVVILVSNKSKSTLTTQQVISQATGSLVRIQGDQGAGSGFVIDPKRQLVLTNAHVVVGNSALQAQIGNGQSSTSPLRIVGADPCDDLAVVKLVTPLPSLTALTLGSSGALKAGDPVTVLGYPGSLQVSLGSDQIKGQATSVVANTGTVSQVGVNATPDPSLPEYQNTIVHQAPVNHGDSGGPLLNNHGQVVGINSLTNVNNQSQYYSIGIDYAKRLLPSLEAGQSRDLIGWNLVALNANDPALEQELLQLYESLPQYRAHAARLAFNVAAYLQRHHINGVFDLGDQPGSPADNVGAAGYLILHMNGDPVPSFASVCSIVSSVNPGSQLRLDGLNIAGGNPQELGSTLNAKLTIPTH